MASAKDNWPNPITWVDMQAALKDGKSTFRSEGRNYQLIKRGKDKFFVKAVDDFIPCGEFTREQIVHANE